MQNLSEEDCMKLSKQSHFDFVWMELDQHGVATIEPQAMEWIIPALQERLWLETTGFRQRRNHGRVEISLVRLDTKAAIRKLQGDAAQAPDDEWVQKTVTSQVALLTAIRKTGLDRRMKRFFRRAFREIKKER